MIEYIEAFLVLGERKDKIEDVRKIITVLHTTELYMTKEQWERYQALLNKVPSTKHQAPKEHQTSSSKI